MRKPAGETSFLESRLQPDSFFGASGGQRIDTREAATSATRRFVVDELFAEPARRHRRRRPGGRGRRLPGLRPRPAGRGDPEGGDARHPGAHGHPHQAARGLRQAARHQGLRAAGHASCYSADRAAKARTGRKAQELGRQHRPRQRAVPARAASPTRCWAPSGQPVEPLGATTVPLHRRRPAPPAFRAGRRRHAATAAWSSTSTSTCSRRRREPPARAARRSRCRSRPGGLAPRRAAGLRTAGRRVQTSPARRRRPRRRPPPAVGLDFDLGDLSSLGAPTPPPASRPRRRAARRALDFGDFGIGGRRPAPPTADGDPLARKLELAEEFRQIGDIEGARDLLEEVVAKAEGALQAPRRRACSTADLTARRSRAADGPSPWRIDRCALRSA
ncbi:MAG: hypothetical protein MZW92_24490 [Comamonadaceae bacterium]|nr:hypothetical protein [Comamonadaceae bacterium]